MRFVVDTNLLVYAVNRDCDEHRAAAKLLDGWLGGTVPWGLTWNVAYEFLRVSTHARVFRQPLTAAQALQFLEHLLGADVVTMLGPGPRHDDVLRTTIREFGRPAGNVFHDLHTAVLMREHGVSEIMTADSDFRKFPFLTAIDPVHGVA